MQWFSAHWQQVLILVVTLETGLARLFPNVGFFQKAEKDLEAVEVAVGVTPPNSSSK